MIFHSPAKLNLYLHIKQKYQNGFHEIDSLFVRINLYDIITISDSPGPNIIRNGDLSYLKKNDLCYKAAFALKQKSGCNLGCSVTLRKKIPIGAGLGGGSSNAATVLKGLNKLWNLGYTKEELKLVAKEIGSDVPFFIEETNCFGSGIGENLIAISNSEFLPKYYETFNEYFVPECEKDFFVFTDGINYSLTVWPGRESLNSCSTRIHPKTDGRNKEPQIYSIARTGAMPTEMMMR